MSILKKLKKQKATGVVLKSGVAVLIDKQEQFNRLAAMFELDEDSIHIDDVYIAYMDDYPALQVECFTCFCEDIDNLLEALSHKNLKPVDFDVWYKKIKS